MKQRFLLNGNTGASISISNSVTRLGDILDFGQLFLKPLATINLPQSSPFLGNYCKGVKIIHFISETFFGQILKTFLSGHTDLKVERGRTI